jgi:3-oxoadipate enol-lactonase
MLPSKDIAFCASGSGPLVVLVHGLAEDQHSWNAQRAALSPNYRVVTYDVRGHGRTPIGEANGTLSQLGDDLVALLEALEAGPATLVGYSLGGTIVLWAAANRPDLVSGVVAIATSSVVGARAASFYRDRIALFREGDPARIRAELQLDIRSGLHRTWLDSDDLLEQHVEAVGDGEGYCNAAEAMMRLHSEPLTPLLARVTCPVLVVGGAEDEFCPRKAQDILVNALPDARYHEIPAVGHLLAFEDPTALSDVVTAFVDEVHGDRCEGRSPGSHRA